MEKVDAKQSLGYFQVIPPCLEAVFFRSTTKVLAFHAVSPTEQEQKPAVTVGLKLEFSYKKQREESRDFHCLSKECSFPQDFSSLLIQ